MSSREDEERNESSRHEANAQSAGASPIGSESSVVNRRDLPGGSFQPARTPGASGPTTRETDTAVSNDANDSLVGRTELAGEIQQKPKDPGN